MIVKIRMGIKESVHFLPNGKTMKSHSDKSGVFTNNVVYSLHRELLQKAWGWFSAYWNVCINLSGGMIDTMICLPRQEYLFLINFLDLCEFMK